MVIVLVLITWVLNWFKSKIDRVRFYKQSPNWQSDWGINMFILVLAKKWDYVHLNTNCIIVVRVCAMKSQKTTTEKSIILRNTLQENPLTSTLFSPSFLNTYIHVYKFCFHLPIGAWISGFRVKSFRIKCTSKHWFVKYIVFILIKKVYFDIIMFNLGGTSILTKFWSLPIFFGILDRDLNIF